MLHGLRSTSRTADNEAEFHQVQIYCNTLSCTLYTGIFAPCQSLVATYSGSRLATSCIENEETVATNCTFIPLWHSDLPTFQDFVGKIKAHGGGDAAEDVMGGLKVDLRELEWRHGGTKVLANPIHPIGSSLKETETMY